VSANFNRFNTQVRGSAVPHLERSLFDILTLRLPSLSEQVRIVELLDAADDLRKLRQQADRRTADLIPAIFHDMFGDPVTNSKGWTQKQLGDVVKLRSGGTPSKERHDFWGGEIPWVSPKDMKKSDLWSSELGVTKLALEQTNLQLFPSNTVLIVVRGMILAHDVPVAICRVPATINQDMKALIPAIEIEPEYLFCYLCAHRHTLQQKVSTASHGTKRLETSRLLETEIMIPPISLQRLFAERAIATQKMIAEQEESRRYLGNLFQAMLHRAFEGEL
jgi:type I restriction enzyme S subunit